MEWTVAEKTSFFVKTCEVSAETGTDFILKHVFATHAPDRNVNTEVTRKYGSLTDFAEKVYIAMGGQRSQIGALSPRQYAEMIRDMHDGEKPHNNRIYRAFMEAGHHIRELTNRPDYILPSDTIPQRQKPQRAVA